MNPQFGAFAFVQRAQGQDGDQFGPMPIDVTVSANGLRMCASIQEEGEYCPGKTFATTSGPGVVPADGSCDSFEEVQNVISSRVTELVGSRPEAPDDQQRVITGSFTIVVEGAANFATNSAIRNALKGAVANIAGSGVTASMVDIDVRVVPAGSGRRLQGETFTINYSITVPDGVEPAAIEGGFSGVSSSDWTEQINTQLVEMGVDGITISVQSVEPVVVIGNPTPDGPGVSSTSSAFLDIANGGEVSSTDAGRGWKRQISLLVAALPMLTTSASW